MKKIFILLIFLFPVSLFAQSQFLLDITHNRATFHIFRNDSVPTDTMKFYNESTEISPVEFSNYNNDEKIVTLTFQPFSYAETKYTKMSFDISEIFGEITVETFSHGLPVRTTISDDIFLENGSSKISFIRYPDNDTYIILNSGKIYVHFGKEELLMIAGETLVFHGDGSYQYIDHFDYPLGINRIISGIIADRQALSNTIRNKMSAAADTSTLSYRRLWVTRRFLEEY